MDKKLKKKFQPKKSVSADDLRQNLSEEELNRRAASRFAPSISKLIVREALFCHECGFETRAGNKIRLIEDLAQKRIVCEVCFESLNITDWRFVDRSRFNY